MPENIILTAADIKRTLARIAHEITEQNQTTRKMTLVGIHTRGVPLARRLAANIEAFHGPKVLVGSLDISLHRDDLFPLKLKTLVHRTSIPTDIDGKIIVLVDDVLYTGRSVRAAMDALIDLGRPQSVQLAVLIDRGHREMPIRPDYVGKNIPSSRHEEIQVKLVETDGTDEVSIISTPSTLPPSGGLRKVDNFKGGHHGAGQ